MNYPIIQNQRNPGILTPTHASYSDEYAQRMCDLYLSDEVRLDENHKPHKYYRLHAKAAHNEEMALSYDIKCPRCGNYMKQVGRTLNFNDLGLYICKSCYKREGGT